MTTLSSTGAALLLPLVLLGGCRHGADEEKIGCGIVEPGLVRDAVGPNVDSRRTDHGCRLADAADRRNYLTIVSGPGVDAESFARQRCSGGWVYAGTPEKFAPACITKTANTQTTSMVSEWDGLKVRVELGRNRDTSRDDAEQILDISRDVAAHVGDGPAG